jgi:PhnB protein
MTQINAFINFNGNAKEAMLFYKECFGGELVMQKFAESPMAAQLPPETGNKILLSSLNSNSIVLLAADSLVTAANRNNNVWLHLHCHTAEEINTFFYKLAAEGEVLEPLHETFRGSTSGLLIDKFGINWMFHYTKKSES